MNDDVPLVTGRALAELAIVAPGVAPASRLDDTLPEELFVEALSKLDDDAIRKLGALRADASISVEEFEGDPLRMLRDASGRFYEGRYNYGATSLEITQRKAIIRFVVSEQFSRIPNGSLLLRSFLERGVEIVTGERMTARFVGNTPRIETRFAGPMYNSVFEFDLES